MDTFKAPFGCLMINGHCALKIVNENVIIKKRLTFTLNGYAVDTNVSGSQEES